MKARSQVSNDLFATRRAGFIRIALATTLMVVILVWISITNAVPAFAADDGDGGIIEPTLPDSSSFGTTIVAIIARVFGAILYAAAIGAIGGAIFLLLKWIPLLAGGSERSAKSYHLRNMLILLAIAGVLAASGTGIFIATADVLGSVFAF